MKQLKDIVSNNNREIIVASAMIFAISLTILPSLPLSVASAAICILASKR